MRAVIVEIKGKYAVALDTKGCFVKIKNNKKYRVGYEFDVETGIRSHQTVFAKAASIAAVFLLVAGLSFGTYSYCAPYSYVDVDINPSIEVTANIFDRIINVKGLNEDGKKFVIAGHFRNMKLNDGIESILASAAEQGYLKENYNNVVMFTVSSKDENKAEQIGKGIEENIPQKLGQININTEIVFENAAMKKHQDAKQMGISTGKLLLIEKLIETQSELEIEDVKDYSVKEIRKSINQSKEMQKNEDEEQEMKNSDEDEEQKNGNGKESEKQNPKFNLNNGEEDDKNKQDNEKDKSNNIGNKENPQSENGQDKWGFSINQEDGKGDIEKDKDKDKDDIEKDKDDIEKGSGENNK